MTTLKKFNRFSLAALAAGVLMTNGCFELPHADLRYSVGLSPEAYCPGDTVTANFDVRHGVECTSRPGFSCPDFMPTVALTSTPEVFPAQSLTAFNAGHTFTPAVDAYTVAFTPDRASVMYPIVETMGRTFAVRATPPATKSGTRINGTIVRELTHNGMCAGSMPVYAPASLPGTPQVSNRMRAQEICNPNSVPITISLTSAASPSFITTLAPGACADPSPPGTPGVGSDARIVEVSSSIIDPNAVCSPLQSNTPPASLRTRITLACGM